MKPLIPQRAIHAVRFGAICTTIAMLLAQTTKPQGIVEPPQAGLEFRCPAYSIACCEPMTLQADVFGDKHSLDEQRENLIAYRWEVSAGRIISGQGTPKVTID